MSTTLDDAPSLSGSRSGTSPRVRLPGEEDHIEAEIPHAPVPDVDDRLVEASRLHNRKTALLSTAAMVFLIGSAGVMSYMRRAEFEHVPTIQRALVALDISGATHSARPGVAERGGSANAQAHQRTVAATAHVSVPPGGLIHTQANPASPPQHAAATSVPANRTSAPPPVKAPEKAGDGNPQQAQLAQFEAFKPGASTPAPHPEPVKPIAPTKVATASPGSPSAPASETAKAAGLPASPATTPLKVATAAPASAIEPIKLRVSPAVAKPVPVPAVANPVAQAVALKPAPMSSEQQINVLHLVTELGVLVRDQRTEIASLREQVGDVSGKVKGELTDFDRRLSLAEADGAINAAMGAGKTLPGAKSAASQPTSVPAAKKVAQAAPPPLVRHVSDYHIQAASPGLAMLTTTIDGGSRITVGVGDEVPGIGRVKAVFQKGTRWVVQTDHGLIKQ